MDNKRDNGAAEFWPSSVANLVLVFAENRPSNVLILAADAKKIALELRPFADSIDCAEAGSVSTTIAAYADRNYDVLVVINEQNSSDWAHAIKLLRTPADIFFLSQSPRIAQTALRDINNRIHVRMKFFVIPSIHRPIHFVPRSISALIRFCNVENVRNRFRTILSAYLQGKSWTENRRFSAHAFIATYRDE